MSQRIEVRETMTMDDKVKATPAEIAARCHEIQTGLGITEVPEFDSLSLIGMAVRLALHIRGLPTINYDVVKLVGYHFLNIPTIAMRQVIELLADIDFVKLLTEGKTIKAILPDVPYYEELYALIGEVALDKGFSEAEEVTIELLHRLAKAPDKVDTLRSKLGVENKLLERVLSIGHEGSYFRVERARGRDILFTPTYFSENFELLIDAVAAAGSNEVKSLLSGLKGAQGYPLSVIQKNNRVGDVEVSSENLKLLMRLAQDGAVKPPSIKTAHSGENHFLFTPTPSGAALAPTKREIYEKAMAIVSAVRQGQFFSAKFAIRSPSAVIYTLRRDRALKKSTTEAVHQYQNLVRLRVAQLVDVGYGYRQLRIIDTPENLEALDIAYSLVDSGVASGIEIDEAAREALQADQVYVESLVASAELHRRKKLDLSNEQQQQLELIFMK